MLLKVVAYASLTLLCGSQFKAPAGPGWGPWAPPKPAPQPLPPRPDPSHEESADSPPVSPGELAKLCNVFLAGFTIIFLLLLFFGHMKLSLYLKVKKFSADLFLLPVLHILITSELNHFPCWYSAPPNRNNRICISRFVQPRQECPFETHLLGGSPCCTLVVISKYPHWVSSGRRAPGMGLHGPATGKMEPSVRGHEMCVVGSAGLQDQFAPGSPLPEPCLPARTLTSVSLRRHPCSNSITFSSHLTIQVESHFLMVPEKQTSHYHAE